MGSIYKKSLTGVHIQALKMKKCVHIHATKMKKLLKEENVQK